MRIRLPNGEKIELDNSLSLEEKKVIVNELISEWNHVVFDNWNDNSVKYFLDSLANYLVWHKTKEEKDEKAEDKFILSRNKTDKLSNHRKDSKTINFSNLNKEEYYLIFGEESGDE